MAGNLIVFEGADGVGKTSIVVEVARYLKDRGAQVFSYAFPGNLSGTLGNLVYNIHHDHNSVGVKSLTPASLQALHVAAHVDAIERLISPNLEENDFVILDRYWWSTQVYGQVNGLHADALSFLIDFEKYFWKGLTPSQLFLIQRKTPLKEGLDPNEWQKTSKLYEDLAAREQSSYPVLRISNDFEVANLIERVKESIRYDEN